MNNLNSLLYIFPVYAEQWTLVGLIARNPVTTVTIIVALVAFAVVMTVIVLVLGCARKCKSARSKSRECLDAPDSVSVGKTSL